MPKPQEYEQAKKPKAAPKKAKTAAPSRVIYKDDLSDEDDNDLDAGKCLTETMISKDLDNNPDSFKRWLLGRSDTLYLQFLSLPWGG